MLATAGKDMYSNIFAAFDNLPKSRPSYYYECKPCQHKMTLRETNLMHSPDESESGVYTCSYCDKIEIKR